MHRLHLRQKISELAIVNLYTLIKKEAPGELRDWGKVLRAGAGESERERRFERLEQKRKDQGLEPREYVLAKDKQARSEAANIIKRLVGGPFVTMPWKDGWYVGEEASINGVSVVYNEPMEIDGLRVGANTLTIDFFDADEVVSGVAGAWEPEAFISVVQEETKLARKVLSYGSVADIKKIVREAMNLFKRKKARTATTTVAERVKDAYMDRKAAVATIRDKCRVTVSIDKAVPYGKPQPAGNDVTDHHFHLLGKVEHDPSFGIPIKFKVHVVVSEDSDGNTSFVTLHTERSGKVVPKAFGPYVGMLIHKYFGSWVGALPLGS